jgi:hypothetical protein
MQFTDDEIETIKNLIKDWGFEYSLSTGRNKLIALAKKLDMFDYARILNIDD